MTSEDNAQNFEKSLQTLEEIVQRLEDGNLTLEQSLKAYEEGVRLTRACEKALSDAEQKVQKLVEADGEVTAEPVEADDTDKDLPF